MFDDLPDDDSDILGGGGVTDGSVTSPDGRVFKLPDVVLRELADSLKEFLDNNHLPREFQAMVGMFDFFCGINFLDLSSPLLAAVAQVLDQETDGKVRAYYELKEAERILSVTHEILRVQNNVLNKFTYEGLGMESTVYQTKFFIYSFINLTNHVQGKAIGQYRLWCERLGQEPDEQLITTGYYTERDFYTRIAMMRPPAKDET